MTLDPLLNCLRQILALEQVFVRGSYGKWGAEAAVARVVMESEQDAA